MKLGMLHLFENPMDRTEEEIVDEQFDLMVKAEEYGFDSVWPAEQHFSEYGYCASPAVSLAAVAARTKTIRLGTGVVVLPLNHPIRVAEDYAIVDLLSKGRVDLGVGRGYQPHEFKGYGVDQSRTRDMFRESVEVIQKAWTEERFSYDGEFYQVDDLSVRPKPLQTPHPPIWMASLSPETFALCGRYGFNLLCAPVFGFDVNTGASQIDQWRQALRDNDRDPADHEIGALIMTYVADTSQQAEEDFADPVLWWYHTFGKYVSPPPEVGPVPTYEMYTATREFANSVTWNQIVQAGAVVCGSPDQVVERIGEITEKTGLTHYLAWIRIGGLAHDKVLRSMELLSSKVMPQLRQVGNSAG